METAWRSSHKHLPGQLCGAAGGGAAARQAARLLAVLRLPARRGAVAAARARHQRSAAARKPVPKLENIFIVKCLSDSGGGVVNTESALGGLAEQLAIAIALRRLQQGGDAQLID